MEEKRKTVTKKMACELAAKVIGSKKVDMQDDIAYYFSTGDIRLRIMNRCIKPTRSMFSLFDVKGSRYEGQALDCTLYVGDYVNLELFYTVEGYREIYHEYTKD